MSIFIRQLCRTAVAATTAASCSLAILAGACAEPAANPPAGKTYHQRHLANAPVRQPVPAHRHLYGSAQQWGTAQWGTGRCTWPYQNRFPPCMSTFPEGSPHYYGGRAGPTFDNE
jgi:hypothetical protein